MHKPVPSRGFTLIEILVVLVIVGVVLATVVVKVLPDDRQALHQEASRLSLLLEHARDEALVSGRSIAWSAEDGAYVFWRRDQERRWQPLTGNEILRERRFASSVILAGLTINRIEVTSNERLIFSPSGLNVPFEAILVLHDQRLVLAGDNTGRVKIKDDK